MRSLILNQVFQYRNYSFLSFVESIGGGLGAFIGIVGALFVMYIFAMIMGGGGSDSNPRDENSQW